MTTIWEILQSLGISLVATVRDVVPIAVIILFFQLFVLRRAVANLRRVVAGFVLVLLGLAVFLVGLDVALFPLGEAMAQQLASPEFVRSTAEMDSNEALPWYRYHWTYVFAFSIGLTTTIAEPALIAVALKAQEVSGGSIRAWALRLAVALGVGTGVALGTFRITTGLPLPYFILGAYLIVIVQTYFAPPMIIPLAYDSGGVATSTVTVPLVAALGLGLASHVPGRNPLSDGFGLIALAALFPIMSVMAYAQLAQWWNTRRAGDS